MSADVAEWGRLRTQILVTRTALGLIGRDVAEAAGVSHASLRSYEQGKTLPNLGTLMKIADALGLRVSLVPKDSGR